MITGLIIQSQQGDSDAILALIEKFKFSLKKYAFKLRYEDAYYDLLADFVELIGNMCIDRILDRSDKAVIAYIYASIYNSYIKKLINLKRQKCYELLPYEALSENDKNYLEVASAIYDSHTILELAGIAHVLTQRELSAIRMLFQLQYSIPEIASAWKVSEQTVRLTKDRALKKIKKWLLIEQAS